MLERVRFGNHLWETKQFNSRQQITQIGLGYSATNAGVWKTDYEYGDWQGSTLDTAKNNGSLARQTITVPTIAAVAGFTAIQTYTQDSLDRLKFARETIGGTETWKQTFLYDRFGNRNFDTGNTTILSSESSVAKVANPEILASNNRFNQDQDNDSQDDYLYDPSGNLTRNAVGLEFAFNAENLQTSATGNGLSMAYSYDGNNKRVKTYDAINDRTTIFVYDANGLLAAEYTINVPPPSVPVISYLTEDALGSVRVTTNSFAEVKARRDFLPFGEELYAGIAGRNANQKYSSSTDDTRKKFATYQRDSETGLDFAQSRYYSPMHGRFTSPDEFKGGPDELFDFEEDASDNPTFYADLSNPQSLNKYQYGYNNPYKYNDPSGHCVGVLKPLCNNPAAADKVNRAVDWIAKSSVGVAIGTAAGYVASSIEASANAGIGDPSCPACGRSQAMGQALMSKSRSEPRQTNSSGDQQATSSEGAKPRGSNNPETSRRAAEGRKRHSELKSRVQRKPGWKSEPSLKDPKTGKTVRPDVVTRSGRPLELKPNTPSGRRQGQKQLPAQERATQKKGRVIYYEPKQ